MCTAYKQDALDLILSGTGVTIVITFSVFCFWGDRIQNAVT